jgi:hypothetical protein
MVPPALPEVRVVMRPVVPQQRAQNVLSNGMMRAGQQLATQMAAKEQFTFARDNFKNVLLGNSATNGIVHETIKSFPKVRAHAVRRQCEREMREQCKEHVRVQRCVRDSWGNCESNSSSIAFSLCFLFATLLSDSAF